MRIRDKAASRLNILVSVFYMFCFLESSFAQNQDNIFPVPTSAQLEWHDAELIALFHYDLHVFDNKKYIQSENRITPVKDYNIFNPGKLDTDQWIKAAKDMGAKCAIITATHETGFALYQSDINPYCLKAVKWRDGKGDIVADFAKSCRKYDLKFGIYIGIRWNSLLGVFNFNIPQDDEFGKRRKEYYNSMVEGMVKELCTRYGQLFQVWFDGGAIGPEEGGPDVIPIFKKYQPDCLFYHNSQRADYRWGGSESGTVPYPCWSTFPYPSVMQSANEKPNFELLKHGDPEGKYWCPAMSDAPLRGYNGRHEWFWEPGDEDFIFPLDNLMDMYYRSVGHNSTLYIGITPDTSGLIPEPDVQRMKEFGDEIKRRFENPVAQTNSKGKSVTIDLLQPEIINHIVIKEDISFGERVREFIVEGNINGKWIKLKEGSCIGHKIILQFETVKVDKLRLTITKTLAEPVIRNLSLFNII